MSNSPDALIRARDFYRQEAAIAWLFADKPTKFYIEHHLAAIFRGLSDMQLATRKFACLAARGFNSCGHRYRSIYYPLDLFERMVNVELEHRIAARIQEDYVAPTTKSKARTLFEQVLDGLYIAGLATKYTDPKPSSDGDAN